MKINFISSCIVFLILTFNINNANAAATKPFPKDTLQHFIKNYGKDSLIEIIDLKLKSAENALFHNKNELINDYTVPVMEYVLINNQFNKILDTSFFEKPELMLNDFYMLYDTIYHMHPDTIKSINRITKENSKMIYKMFTQSMQYLYPKLAVILVIDELNNDTYKKIADTLYRQSLKSIAATQLENFYVLTEYSKRNLKGGLANAYYSKLFKHLFPLYNYDAYYKSIKKFEESKQMMMAVNYGEMYNNHLRFLAYATYSGNINLVDNSKELMQVLAAQTSFGYWDSDYVKNEDYLESSTIYGYWILLQFKQLLLENK
ncbi:MAG: hypothetical protein U0T07_06735 [Chitinophagales bacterium]